MDLYISALLSLLVLLLLVAVFYLYKQNSLILVKINKLAYDVNVLEKNDEGSGDMQNMFGNMDMMNNFMNSLPQDTNEEELNDEEELDDEDEQDGSQARQYPCLDFHIHSPRSGFSEKSLFLIPSGLEPFFPKYANVRLHPDPVQTTRKGST